ncbi:MAG: hypothetical protein VX217_02245, partial [Acidobacteriota bacterium]|nr:hypothetical protein [Acidobacteriota bacterium]
MLIILVLGMLASVACTQPVSNYPELVLTGGAIYPLGDSNAPVPALAIRGDRVTALGNNAEILELAGPYTQQMDLEGSSVLAGTYDAWIDLEALGRWSSTSFDVRLASSIEEVQAMVRNA